MHAWISCSSRLAALSGRLATRFFTLWHRAHGGVRLGMISDDGMGAAERQAGVDYTLALIRQVYEISAWGPWTNVRGFELTHDRVARTVSMSSVRLIKDGVQDLLGDELRFRPPGPCQADIKQLALEPAPEKDTAGYAEWERRASWFKRAVGWAIHVTMVHSAGDFTLSVLSGLSSSPSVAAVKAMKHYVCWLETRVERKVTWGGGPPGCLIPPSHDVILHMINTRGGPLPWCLLTMTDSDLQERSRYSAAVFLNGAPVWTRSRIQPSIAVDITDSESYGFSIGGIITEVVRGKMEDMGHAEATEQPTVIGGDNDATLRIAADAASAKRALYVLRRVGHTRYLTDMGKIKGLKMDRSLNIADAGTHYITRDEMAYVEPRLRGEAQHRAP